MIIEPIGPVQAYESWHVTSPKHTHTRKATCQEVGCQFYAEGWKTVVDESTDLGQRQAHYIRSLSGRRFVEYREANLTVFKFYPEQKCFTEHRVSLNREPFYVREDGDFRGNPTGRRRVIPTGSQFVDEFNEAQERRR